MVVLSTDERSQCKQQKKNTIPALDLFLSVSYEQFAVAFEEHNSPYDILECSKINLPIPGNSNGLALS